jgi:hypothetical protein
VIAIHHALDWFSSAETAESFITRLWIFLFTMIGFSIFFIILIRVPRSFSEWAMLGLIGSMVIVVARTIYLLMSPHESIPQPWALFLWTAAFALLLPFAEYFRREYLVPAFGWALGLSAFVLALAAIYALALLSYGL